MGSYFNHRQPSIKEQNDIAAIIYLGELNLLEGDRWSVVHCISPVQNPSGMTWLGGILAPLSFTLRRCCKRCLGLTITHPYES
jgi:hypothetical protein